MYAPADSKEFKTEFAVQASLKKRGNGLTAATFVIALIGAVVVPGPADPASTARPDENSLAAVERIADFFATRLAVSGGTSTPTRPI